MIRVIWTLAVKHTYCPSSVLDAIPLSTGGDDCDGNGEMDPSLIRPC